MVDDIDSIGECSLLSNNSSEEFFNICRTDPEVDINSDALSDCSSLISYQCTKDCNDPFKSSSPSSASLISYQCTKDCNDPFKSSSPSSASLISYQCTKDYIDIEQLVDILNHNIMPVLPVQPIEEKDCSVEDMIASILQDPL